WRLETPIELRPERTLRALLSRIGHDELRRDRLAALDRLERARDRVGAAAGRPAALGPALDALETTFTEITGAASARPAATAPVGRALAFEDCRRDVEVGLGEAVLGRLAAPLALLLDSGRWLTWETARRYRLALSDLHRAQSRRTGGAGVELSRLALLAHPLFQAPGRPGAGARGAAHRREHDDPSGDPRRAPLPGRAPPGARRRPARAQAAARHLEGAAAGQHAPGAAHPAGQRVGLLRGVLARPA